MFLLDCMHLWWKACPAAFKGQFQGQARHPIIILEAGADHNLWIWHSSFGCLGTQNDLSIWDQPPLHTSLFDGSWWGILIHHWLSILVVTSFVNSGFSLMEFDKMAGKAGSANPWITSSMLWMQVQGANRVWVPTGQSEGHAQEIGARKARRPINNNQTIQGARVLSYARHRCGTFQMKGQKHYRRGTKGQVNSILSRSHG